MKKQLLNTFFILFFSLEDIEIHFSDNKKKFTDIKIQKNAQQQRSLSALADKNGCDNRAFSEDDKKY